MSFPTSSSYYGPAGIPLPSYDRDASSVTPPPTPFTNMARNANTTFPRHLVTPTPIHGVNAATTHGNCASPGMGLPTISPVIVDKLAKDFQLEDVQRANLHGFFKVCKVVSRQL
jgi:hypothetical protein